MCTLSVEKGMSLRKIKLVGITNLTDIFMCQYVLYIMLTVLDSFSKYNIKQYSKSFLLTKITNTISYQQDNISTDHV